jgi:hypothetical protein
VAPLAASLALQACAGAPPPTATAASAPARTSWICAAAPERVTLSSLGVPVTSVPVDAALGNGTVTVLFDPSRVVVFSIDAADRKVTMVVGDPSDTWRAIDRDPFDGSLWIASDQTVSLVRIGPDGQHFLVKGPAVSGQGGFTGIRLDREALYATPTSAAELVWRLSRDGRLLGRSFTKPSTDEEAVRLGSGARNRSAITLGRDSRNQVLALERMTGKLFQADPEGNFVPTGAQFPVASDSKHRTVQGESVGTSNEVWYVGAGASGLFFIGDSPATLGPSASGVHARGDIVFRLTSDTTVASGLESCAAGGLREVVSDGTTFVALTGSHGSSSQGRTVTDPPEILVGRFRSP